MGIRIILAGSPQVRSRVERSNGTHQERLVPKLALKHLTTIETANRFIESTNLSNHHKSFAKTQASKINMHRPMPENLDEPCIIEAHRQIANDLYVRWSGRLFQLQPHSSRAPIVTRVILGEDLHSIVTATCRGVPVPVVGITPGKGRSAWDRSSPKGSSGPLGRRRPEQEAQTRAA